MNQETAPHIILSTGPVHLFWTTGVYYLWELSRANSLSLIVNENYKDDLLFHRVINLCSVEEVIYLPSRSNIIARHRFYSKVLRNLVQKHPHAVVLQYNDVYADNYYLTHFAKKQNPIIKVVIFQAGQLLPDYAADYAARNSFAVDRLKARFHIPSAFAKLIHYLKGEIKHLLEFKLLPLITLGEVFDPKMKLITGKLILKNIWNDIDFKLYYKENEMQVAMKLEGDCNRDSRRFLIRHPLEAIGEECNEKLYPEHEDNLVVILPSYGNANALASQTGSNESDIVNWISQKWCEAIAIFEKNLKGWGVVWKLHPSAAQDRLFQTITCQVQRSFPNITIMPSSEKASSLILRSKIILSDISTVLWWASFIKGKVPISLDIFQYPSGDGMKGYEGIFYFQTIPQLQDFLREWASKPDPMAEDNPISTKTSLTSFLSSLQR